MSADLSARVAALEAKLGTAIGCIAGLNANMRTVVSSMRPFAEADLMEGSIRFGQSIIDRLCSGEKFEDAEKLYADAPSITGGQVRLITKEELPHWWADLRSQNSPIGWPDEAIERCLATIEHLQKQVRT